MSAVSPIEKRASERLPATELSIQLSLKGHRVKSALSVLNYNRDGMAFLSNEYLDCKQKLRLLITWKNNQIGPIEAAVHNCRKLKSGEFRCGIQFRTNSPNQLDRNKIIHGLGLLEDVLRKL